MGTPADPELDLLSMVRFEHRKTGYSSVLVGAGSIKLPSPGGAGGLCGY